MLVQQLFHMKSEPRKFIYFKNITTLLTTVQAKPGVNGPITPGGSTDINITYRKCTNFCGHNISWVKSSRGLIFVGKSSQP